MLANADNYYVLRFQIYLGKNRMNSELFQLKGLGYYVVWTLGEPYLDDHRHFCFDARFGVKGHVSLRHCMHQQKRLPS